MNNIIENKIDEACEELARVLKEKGYLKVIRMRDPVRNVFYYEYELLEMKVECDVQNIQKLST